MPATPQPLSVPSVGQKDARAPQALLAQMQELAQQISLLQPPDQMTVPLIVSVDLAEEIQARADAAHVDVPLLYNSLLAAGLFYQATLSGTDLDVIRAGRILRRLMSPEQWAQQRRLIPLRVLTEIERADG